MYSRSSSSPFDNFRSFVHRGGTPFTNGLLIACVVSLFANFLSNAFYAFAERYIQYHSGERLAHPWGLVTYPLFQRIDIVNLIFSGMWMWFVGSSLERSWGSARFAGFFFATSALFAVSISLAQTVLRLVGDLAIWGLYPPLAGLTVAWCSLMPEQSVSIWWIPVKAKYLAIVVVLVLWFELGRLIGPLPALFGELSPLAAYLYVRYGRSWGDVSHQTPRGRVVKLDFDRKGRPQRTSLDGSVARSPFDIAGRLKDFRERRRLEKLLRNSGINDPGWADDDRKYK